MTKQEFYTDRSAEALRIAYYIVNARRERAGIGGICAADIDMEYSLILQEWYDDYRSERD